MKSIVESNKYIIIAGIALLLRVLIDFSSELIPGGGGYYPLQVRTVLETGQLGIVDMPFLFYFDAGIIKLLSFIGFTTTDSLILTTVKIIDVITIPLLLIPLHSIIKNIGRTQNKWQLTIIIAFSVLSFSPFMLLAGFQKNAMAVVFLFSFIASYIAYQKSKKGLTLASVILFFFLTGLTHFGTFSILLIFVLFSLLIQYKWKAILPLIMIALIGLGLIAFFDIVRFHRLLAVGSNAFSFLGMFGRRVNPIDILMKLFSWFIIYSAISYYRKPNDLSPNEKSILLTSIACLIVFSFPFLEGEYSTRIGVFQFIPQLLILLIIGSDLNEKARKGTMLFMGIVVVLAVFTVPFTSPPAALKNDEFTALKKIDTHLKNTNKSKTIIISRHGLEWWVAWSLRTKIGQISAVDKKLFDQYETVLFLNQIKGLPPKGKKEPKDSPFAEPSIPNDAQLVYTSSYFNVYQVKKWSADLYTEKQRPN